MTVFKHASCCVAFAICFLYPMRDFARATRNIVRPGAVWNDTQGAEIEAHGGGVIRYAGKFFWFGEDRTQGQDLAKRYVSCYESLDLVRWTKSRRCTRPCRP